MEEDEAEIQENERGIVHQNGRPVGPRTAGRSHVFVNPSARVAAKIALSKRVSVEAFVLGNSGAFREDVVGFGTRATNVSGGATANADFGLANAVFAFEHRDAYAGAFGAWKSSGDKVGATFNKTVPFFVQGLTLTPQLLTARDMVDPARSSAITLEATAGLTYQVSPRLSVAASAGYGALFLYGLPGARHDDGPKALVGANYTVSDNLLRSVGASTNRTVFYGVPRYRSDGSLSPSASVRYNPFKNTTITVAASYGRFLSTVTGNSTFKFNINPGLALSIPL